jgi:hypothetical protein
MAAPVPDRQHVTVTPDPVPVHRHHHFPHRPMNSFIATASVTAFVTPAADTIPPGGALSNAALVTNDGWFPAIDLTALRAAMRLDGTVTHERLRCAVIDAIASVNTELAVWRDAQRAAGHACLADVPAPSIGGESVQLARYRRAVYHLAHAELTERYRDYDATKSGSQKADELDTTVSDARRNARWALNDLRGIPRTTVELI